MKKLSDSEFFWIVLAMLLLMLFVGHLIGTASGYVRGVLDMMESELHASRVGIPLPVPPNAPNAPSPVLN